MGGVDISHYQGNVDWPRLKTQPDIDFVWLKATEGNYYVDPRLKHNAAAAESVRLPFGIYHFYEPTVNAQLQAEHFLQVYRTVSSKLRPVLDVEIIQSANEHDLIAGVRQWLGRVEAATGCQPLVYSSKSFWTRHLSAAFSSHSLWLAEYRSQPPDGQWLLWQRTQNGRVAGITGYVDVNTSHPSVRDVSSLACPRSLAHSDEGGARHEEPVH